MTILVNITLEGEQIFSSIGSTLASIITILRSIVKRLTSIEQMNTP